MLKLRNNQYDSDYVYGLTAANVVKQNEIIRSWEIHFIGNSAPKVKEKKR